MRTAAAFLGGLKDDRNSPTEIAGLTEMVRCTEQHGRVAIVPAGMHPAPDFRGIRKLCFLNDGQRVHVGAQADYRAPSGRSRIKPTTPVRPRPVVTGSDVWKNPADGRWLRSCTIITTDADELIAPIHDRMPVILDSDDWPAWLGEVPANDNQLKAILKPYPSERSYLGHRDGSAEAKPRL